MIRLRHPLLATVASLVMAGASQAAEHASAPSCDPDPTDSPVTIAAVSDTLDVTLADGRTLRLAGLDAPLATEGSPDLPARARDALKAWSAAPDGVVLHALGSGLDRWGRVSAQLFRKDATDAPTSGAKALILAGLARARPETVAQNCFSTLLAAEAEARAERRGLWADPRYAVLDAADTKGLAAQAGGMVLVQGFLHLHESRGALYLALGRDRGGFVAVVSRRDAQRFGKAGLDLADYEGTPVRLRGDLDMRFGPRLRLVDPDAIESLEPGSLGAEPDAKHWTARARPR
jgi:micrococcal nuclease